MKIEVLNGFSRVTVPQESELGGFSRINKKLSGNYWGDELSGRKERKARREERREGRKEKKEERREERKEKKMTRREGRAGFQRRQQRRLDKKEKRSAKQLRKENRGKRWADFGDKLTSAAKNIFNRETPEMVDQFVPEPYRDMANQMISEGYAPEQIADEIADQVALDADQGLIDDSEGGEKGLFNKKSKFQKWWKKRSSIEKVGLVAGTVLAADALLFKGNIVLKRVGVMKGKKK